MGVFRTTNPPTEWASRTPILRTRTHVPEKRYRRGALTATATTTTEAKIAADTKKHYFVLSNAPNPHGVQFVTKKPFKMPADA